MTPILTTPFLSVRDVRFARGRYALMGAVVALICLLLVFLTGLTNGLAHQNISAVTAWKDAAGSDQRVSVVFGAPHAESTEEVEVSFTSSQISADQLQSWADSPEVAWAEPVGISQSRADSGTSAAAVAMIAVEPGSRLLPADADRPDDGLTGLLLSAPAAEDLGAQAGDELTVNGRDLTVQGVVEGEYYSHIPVVWLPLEQWRTATHAEEGTATALVVGSGTDVSEEQLATVAADTATSVTDVYGALSALPAYSSENGSLVMMQAFLYGISALVIAAFMAVFTVQRTRDIAVLKALGATHRWVITDGLLQAGIVLLVGAALGTALGTAGAVVAAQAVPVQVDWVTAALPFGLTVVLGMLAAAVAVWRTTRVDPLLALGGS